MSDVPDHVPDGPESPAAAELAAEQRWLDRAHAYLVAMQARTAEVGAIADRMVVEEDNTVNARIARYHLGRREAALREGRGPLCFGRIDTDTGDRWYIGRRHVEDAEARPVVVDWRAPISTAFYRATALDPFGLEHRRRFIVEDRTIVDLIDEDLTDPGPGGHGGLPDPLLAELGRSRTGQMGDIVATIAAEQDLIIRAPLDELLMVQGGPGTGKTAVGLHRAAFLLFEHRRQLEDSKVLVVGPNPLFLRYISQVLPSLGETAVSQATLEGLVAARYRARGSEPDEVARLKGDEVMAKVVAAAVRNRFQAPPGGLELRAGLAVVRLDRDDLSQLLKTALAGRLPVNQGREVFRRLVVQEAWRRHSSRPGADPGGEPLFASAVRADATVRKAIDRMWPNLSPPVLVRDLFRSPSKLARAADGLLDGHQQALLRRKAPGKVDEEPWTVADLPLLDEAQYRIGGVPATYGHVVVDEAQDLSPMALRMVARRAARGSMTILGDLAQATSVHAPGSWDVVRRVLDDQVRERSARGQGVTAQLAELTVGYRVPAAILEVANRLLPEAAPGVTPASAVRDGGDPPLIVAVDGDRLTATVLAEVTALRERTASVAVVALEERLAGLATSLTAAGVPADRVGGAGLPGSDAVALVTPQVVKGLEFDAVVVVEPAEITALDAGFRHLYVAMTRAVQHLGIVHAQPLPELLVPAHDTSPTPRRDQGKQGSG
jgi:DNA helicase IV